MKALTLTQPWATLVAIGAKSIETRSWSTGYRGPVSIHAAKGFPIGARSVCHAEPFRSVLEVAGYEGASILPVGVIIAVADLTNCYRFDPATIERVRAGSARGRWPEHEGAFGDFTEGRFGFALGNVRRLAEPIPARGMLSLWQVPADIEAAIGAQLGLVPA